MPLAVAVVVLVVVLGVFRLVDPPGSGAGGSGYGSGMGSGSGSGSGDGGDPPVLRLAGWTPPAGTSSSVEADARYQLDTDLPGERTSAAVHRLVDDTGADARALAKALGLTGDGEDGAGLRRWVDGPRQLSVRTGDGGSWTYLAVTGMADPPVGDTSAARSAARAVVEAAGLDPASAQDVASGSAVTLTVDPVVDGRPTTGLTTTVIAAGTTVLSAQGWLAATERGATYPVISAREAWDVLVRTALPMPLMACPEPAPGTDNATDPVGCGRPLTVTGARLGLSLQWAGPRGSEPLLVPSWLFDVAGAPLPLAQVAVDPAYVTVADPGSRGGSTEGGSGVGGSVGSTGTATAEPGAPPDQAVPPDQPMSRFTAVTRSADDRSVDVTFWGGVDECYEYTVTAAETDTVVTLSLRERNRGAQACIELAQEHTRTVSLDAPLGVRRVVDAETGETLLGPTR